MKIVCLAAQMRSGKDVVADYLVETFGKRCNETWVKRGWAEGLKQVISDCFGISREEIEKWKVDPTMPPGYIVTMRQALQMVGDGFRQIKPDVWISWTLSRSKEQPTVIPDGRYVNELRAVREAGGVNVLIVRPGYINDSPHPSEAQLRPIVEFYDRLRVDGEFCGPGDVAQEVEDWSAEAPSGAEYIDFVIRNDGTLDDLKTKLNNYLMPFLTRRLGYPDYVCKGTFRFTPEDLSGGIPVEHFFPGGTYASVQGGQIDPIQPIWGRMGEWVLYHQQPGSLTVTPSGFGYNFNEKEALMRLFDLTVEQAEAVLQRLQEVRGGTDWKEVSNCEEMTSRLNMAFNLKGCQLLSDYDILTKYMKYSPEEANEIIARLRKQRLEELKLQIITQNPQILGQPPAPAKPIIEPKQGETFAEMIKRKFDMDEGDLFAMYCVMSKWVEQDHKKFHG